MEIYEFEWRDFSILGVFLAFLDCQDSHTKNEFKNDQIEGSIKKPKNEILQLEAKSVVMED